MSLSNTVILQSNMCLIGQGFCPVNFFTGHGQIWTRVQEWTRVQDPMCPVKKFTGHKPGPCLILPKLISKMSIR